MRRDPRDHNWYHISENHYICARCGLENINGASGDIVLEDLTSQYGNDEYYVAGYWARNNVQFYYYVSLFMKDTEEEHFLEAIEVTERTDVRALE